MTSRHHHTPKNQGPFFVPGLKSLEVEGAKTAINSTLCVTALSAAPKSLELANLEGIVKEPSSPPVNLCKVVARSYVALTISSQRIL